MKLQPMSQVVSRPLDWLWPGRLAFGKLALLDGDPDLGKSLITLDLCARLSTGRPLPDGSAGSGPISCLLLCAEDGRDDCIRPRLGALDADLERVFLWPREEVGLPRFPSQIQRLDETIADNQARFVVLDPIMAFLDPAIVSASDQSVRLLMEGFLRLAEKHQCVILMLRHLSKRSGTAALYRGGGSIAFTAASRFAWLVAADPETPGRCVLAQLRNSQAPPQPSLAYTLEVNDPSPHADIPPGSTPMPRLTWLGPTTWTADDLLASRRGRPALDLAHAKDFLTAFLKEGPRTSKPLRMAAHKQGVSYRTLLRAKAVLEITCKRVKNHGRLAVYWLLPGHELPRELRIEDKYSLEPWFRRMEGELPGRVPPLSIDNDPPTAEPDDLAAA